VRYAQYYGTKKDLLGQICWKAWC